MPKKQRSRGRRAFAPAAVQRLARASSDMPFETIAREIGMNRETVRRQLRGTSELSAEMLARLCWHLGLSADDMLFRGR